MVKEKDNLELRLMIKDFGKIESADILLNDFIVFVGTNNSGKQWLCS